VGGLATGGGRRGGGGAASAAGGRWAGSEGWRMGRPEDEEEMRRRIKHRTRRMGITGEKGHDGGRLKMAHVMP
jgi:hypothetical protein